MRKRKKIFVCSPYGGDPDNLNIAADICADLMRRGHYPFAPHLIYTRFLDETDSRQRADGIEAGLVFMESCDEVHMCLMPGQKKTAGMLQEEEHAKRLGKHIVYVDWT